MSVDVRPCTSAEEAADAIGVISQYFGMERSVEGAERFLSWIELDRVLGAWEGDRIVGGAGAFSFDVSVPGGNRVPAAGVSVIGVEPTDRRRGVLTAMMRAQLDDAHRRGESFAYLWASEGTIYGRFGYGLASQAASIALPNERTAFALPFEPRGSVRFVTPEEALDLFPPLYERVRDFRPGMFSRTHAWWEGRRLSDDPARRRPGQGPLKLAVVDLDGQAAGYVAYRISPGIVGGITTAKVIVVELIAPTPEAERELWRFVLSLDWKASVEYDYLPTDNALVLLLAHPRYMKQTLFDSLWVRLVDVGKALESRELADGSAVVLEIGDAFCPWNAGRWKVQAGTVGQTDDAADLSLDVSSLGSVYLGGFSFGDLVRGLRATELREGAAAKADALFRTDAGPWCPEIF
jgi:predicted acetyltransferase